MDKRVVRRDRIRQITGWLIDVDSENRTKQVADVLTGAFWIWWKRWGGVAGRDVKESVFRAKLQGASVMASSLPGNDLLFG